MDISDWGTIFSPKMTVKEFLSENNFKQEDIVARDGTGNVITFHEENGELIDWVYKGYIAKRNYKGNEYESVSGKTIRSLKRFLNVERHYSEKIPEQLREKRPENDEAIWYCEPSV